MRYFLICILVMITSGCGMKLNEMRTLDPDTKIINKEPTCVFNKLNGKAITTQTESFFVARFIWSSNWDNKKRNGELFAMMDDQYRNYHMLFNIYDEGNHTKIEMRVPKSSYEWIKAYAKSIFETDFSSCDQI